MPPEILPILAQSDLDPWKVISAIGLFVLTVERIIAGIQKAAGKGGTKIEPSPLQIEAAPRFAPAAELQRLESELSRIRAQMVDQERTLREEIRRDVAELHQKINGLSREVSSNTTAQEVANQQLIQIGSKLDRIIEKSL